MKSRFLHEPLDKYASTSEIPEEMIGLISEDRSAIAGKGNWCYIYEGSNNYRKGYLDEGLSSLADEWASIFENRQRICDRLGLKFLQIIIPNKLSVIPEFFPEILNNNISFILQAILKKTINANIFIPLLELSSDAIRESVFRRNDSHLTVAGNALLTDSIMDKMGVSPFEISQIATKVITHSGDLGIKFESIITEQVSAPLWNQGLFAKSNWDKVVDYNPGNLNGIRQVIINNGAPIKNKIVVFGNSFFERVPSWGLSPYFAAIFSEFHFIWSPGMDAKYIKEGDFDYVICQTCERFLNKLTPLNGDVA